MKKFITITCAALACTSLALGLTACGDKDKGSKVSSLKTMNAMYQKYTEDKVFTTAEKVASLAGYTYASVSYGNFKRLDKIDTTTYQTTNIALFNVKTGKVVSFNDEDTTNITRNWGFYNLNNYYIFDRQNSNINNDEAWSKLADNIVLAGLEYSDASDPTKDHTSIGFYDANGNKFAETDELSGPIVVNEVVDNGESLFYFDVVKADGKTETYYFNEKCEQVSYDPVSKMFEGVLSAYNITEIKGENGGYLHYDSQNKKYVSYAEDLSVKHVYDLPSAANVQAKIVFDSGNYILQYWVEQSMDAAKYDILSDGYKYDMTTVFVNVEDGKTKELNCKYVLSSTTKTPAYYAELEEEDGEVWNLTEGVDAYFQGIGEIGGDKRVDYNHKYDWFGISEDGTIKRAAAVVEGMDVVEAVELANGNFSVADTADRTYVVSADGAILKEYNEDVISDLAEGGNDAYVQIGDKFYNDDFTVAYTLPENYEVVGWMNKAVVLKETIAPATVGGAETYKWYILKDGETTLIADSTAKQQVYVQYGLGCMVTKADHVNGEYVYSCTYYNENGVKIDSINDQIYLQYSAGSSDDGSVVYWVYKVFDKNGAATEHSIIKLAK